MKIPFSRFLNGGTVTMEGPRSGKLLGTAITFAAAALTVGGIGAHLIMGEPDTTQATVAKANLLIKDAMAEDRESLPVDASPADPRIIAVAAAAIERASGVSGSGERFTEMADALSTCAGDRNKAPCAIETNEVFFDFTYGVYMVTWPDPQTGLMEQVAFQNRDTVHFDNLHLLSLIEGKDIHLAQLARP